MTDKIYLSHNPEPWRKAAHEWLKPRLKAFSERYGFQYNRVAIKNNFSNWGSCSIKKNINLNLHLMQLPEELRDYVICHELCHLKHLNHGPRFHAELERMCHGHRTLEKQLKQYRFRR